MNLDGFQTAILILYIAMGALALFVLLPFIVWLGALVIGWTGVMV